MLFNIITTAHTICLPHTQHTQMQTQQNNTENLLLSDLLIISMPRCILGKPTQVVSVRYLQLSVCIWRGCEHVRCWLRHMMIILTTSVIIPKLLCHCDCHCFTNWLVFVFVTVLMLLCYLPPHTHTYWDRNQFRNWLCVLVHWHKHKHRGWQRRQKT